MRRICLLIFGISIFLLLFLPNADAQTGIYPAPILLEPTNGQKLRGEAVTFRWAWEGELAEDEYFCVEVWDSKMEPISAPLRLTRSTSLSVPVVDLLSGDYQWRVTVMRVVDRCPEEELSGPSDTWNFSWDQTILMWVKKNIVVVLVCATVILALITVSVIRDCIEKKLKDWEKIIDKEIDNALLKKIYLELPIVVKDDSLKGVPRLFRKCALHRYYNEHGEKDRLVYLSKKEYGYTGLQLADIPLNIARSWESMIDYLDSSDDQGRLQFKTLSDRFILSLTQTLQSIEIEEPVAPRDYMYGYLLRMSTPRNHVPPSIPVVFLQKTVFTGEDVAEIVDFVKEFGTGHSLAILITCDPPDQEGESARQLRSLMNASSHADDFIIWQLIDILHVLRARDRFERFLQMIITRRSALSHPI